MRRREVVVVMERLGHGGKVGNNAEREVRPHSEGQAPEGCHSRRSTAALPATPSHANHVWGGCGVFFSINELQITALSSALVLHLHADTHTRLIT
jgi:hypothetical protein